MIQLKEVIRRFVVASDHDGKHGSAALSRVVLVKVFKVAVSSWYRHAIEVVFVAEGL